MLAPDAPLREGEPSTFHDRVCAPAALGVVGWGRRMRCCACPALVAYTEVFECFAWRGHGRVALIR